MDCKGHTPVMMSSSIEPTSQTPMAPHQPSTVRVRIAPSPTGFMHIGTARTALYNFLFAKKHQGVFICRIEDTDTERSQATYTQNILEGLKLLGITVDEGIEEGGAYGPYAQSQRSHLYQAYAHKLLEEGKAYWSYETEETLARMREEAQKASQPFVFREIHYTEAQRIALENDPHQKPSLRFRVPRDRGIITVEDQVRGTVSVDSQLIGDFVLLKADGMASFHFANVVDDGLMQITHVIRGEDHLSNTARHILLYEALGFPQPVFAHVSMILSQDRSKLSKRHGAMAVSEYIHQGYHPEAFLHFLAFMGWAPPEGTPELASLETLAEVFTLTRLSPSGAIYDMDKLNWLNGLKIRTMPLESLYQWSIDPTFGTHGFWGTFDPRAFSKDRCLLMLDAVREPMKRLEELPEHVRFFFEPPILTEEIQTLALADKASYEIIEAFQQQFPWDLLDCETPESHLEIAQALKTFAKSSGHPMKKVMWAIRAAVTGRIQGADLSKTLWILGQTTVLQRLAALPATLPKYIPQEPIPHEG
jgi:nondiscriminating glutamyl-tRNA synthetase